MQMDFEQWVKDTPKPLVAGIFIAVFIFFWISFVKPLHTICDTQTENLKENQKGVLFSFRDKKKGALPVVVQKARETCIAGNSPGACYEFFDIMKKLSSAIKNTASECYAAVGKIDIERYFSRPVCAPDTKEDECDMGSHRINVVGMKFTDATLEEIVADAIQMMAFKAWGEAPPEPGPLRLGWFSEAEIAVFCHLKDVYVSMTSEEDMMSLRKKTFRQFPGYRQKPILETPGLPGQPPQTEPEQPPPPELPEETIDQGAPQGSARRYLTEMDVFQRSLFSVRCDNFR